MEEEFDNEIIEQRVKKLLHKFTEDFSSADIQFIKDLTYPVTIKVLDLSARITPDNDGRYVYVVDDLYDLEDLFKKLPVNCKVVIPTLMGKMTLISREDK